ncbi:hypothetical protein JTB14_008748 [Gonioctena quinquepunctata]|nr:hypothetical protein JTB14_008748 [Gonioctena quinquepunctata]
MTVATSKCESTINTEQFDKLIETAKTMQTTSSNNISTADMIPLESFCEKNEIWDIYIKRLDNFFSMKKFTGTSKEIDDRKKEWLIHTMETETLQLLFNLTKLDQKTNPMIIWLPL